METSDIPQPLRDFLSAHFDVELYWHAWHEGIRKAFEADPALKDAIRRQFAELITRSALDVETYRTLTNHRFADGVQLRLWLRDRWIDLFGDIPIPGDD